MNWLKVNNHFGVIVFLLVGVITTSCLSEKRKYLNKSASDWESYVQKISGEQKELNNSVLLILKSKECEPCIDELKWWNDLDVMSKDLDIYLVIIEKYETTFATFLAHNEFNLPAFRDDNGLVLGQKLVPHTPVKVYINQEGEVELLEETNIYSDPEEFFSKITPKS